MKISKQILTKLINVAVSNEIKTDMDLNQMKEHKFSNLKFGTGELRYLFQYKTN